MLVTDVGTRDLEKVQGTVLLIAVIVLVIGFVVDIVHGLIDPRLRDRRMKHLWHVAQRPDRRRDRRPARARRAGLAGVDAARPAQGRAGRPLAADLVATTGSAPTAPARTCSARCWSVPARRCSSSLASVVIAAVIGLALGDLQRARAALVGESTVHLIDVLIALPDVDPRPRARRRARRLVVDGVAGDRARLRRRAGPRRAGRDAHGAHPRLHRRRQRVGLVDVAHGVAPHPARTSPRPSSSSCR